MDINEFSRNLGDILFPAVYRSGVTTDAAPFTLLARHTNWITMGRYALGVLPWESVKKESDLLRAGRRAAKKHFFTIPYLFQIGLYLVIPGPQSQWSAVASGVESDTTAFHSVIVQAIHFIDLETRKDVVKRSRWGLITFGGTMSVTDAIDAVLDNRGKGDTRLPI